MNSYVHMNSAERASLNLAVKKCIESMSSNSENTLNHLFNGNEISKKTNFGENAIDDAIARAAISILNDLYRSLKTEICRADRGMDTNNSDIMPFLRKSADETPLDILRGYAKEKDIKSGRAPLSWREIDVLSASERSPKGMQRVPANVPPLDPIQVGKCVDAATPRRLSSEKRLAEKISYVSPLKIISDVKIRSSEESSLSDDAEDLKQMSQEMAYEVIHSVKRVDAAIRHGHTQTDDRVFVDRSCGTTPRSLTKCPKEITSADMEQALRLSKEVQTNWEAHKVDVGTYTSDMRHIYSDNGESSSFSATVHSSLRIVESANSSSLTAPTTITTSTSLYSSDLSAGQVPMRKAVLLLEGSKRRLIPVNADGSLAMTTHEFNRTYEPISSWNESVDHISSRHDSLADQRASRYAAEHTSFGVEKGIQHQHPNEVISSSEGTRFSSRRSEQHYGIPLKIEDYSHVQKDNASVAYSSSGMSAEVQPAASSSFGRSPILVRDSSLLTTFESSSGNVLCTNERERLRHAIGSPSIATLSDSNNSRSRREYANEFYQRQTEHSSDLHNEGDEILSKSSSGANQQQQGTVPTSSETPQEIISQHIDDEEESTLNQISPLPTSG